MFPIVFPTISLSLPIYPIFWILAIFLGLFLFWRAGRHELIDSDFLFDVIVVATLGGLVTGRIFEFAIHYERFAWSVQRLVFFNVWGGLDFYGAVVGAIVSMAIFLKGKKVGLWQVFDLICAPLVFAQSLVMLGRVVSSSERLYLYYFLGYFLIFWGLKRLEAKKRHVGFFACFYLVSIGLLDLFLFGFGGNPVKIAGVLPYQLATGTSLLCFGSISWYILAGRNPKDDIRGFFALLLLALFKTRRILTTVREADEVARYIILLPYFVVRVIYLVAAVIFREIIEGMRSFIHALGFRRLR
ncbi:prolipoprotein diacylglyceryl transferase [Candidatus Curtissbacteria bacterium]|nr:prolipoprotein diacylglyceryl transferase [Candidatus Curtissbacteria bacterium]